MRAVILSIGSEILRGDIVDTNAAFLARELTQRGFEMERVVQVGDTMDGLTAVLRSGLHDADLVLTTGGLGPTQDDLTRQAIAAVLQEEIRIEESLLRQIEERFAVMNRPMPANNNQQAQIIPSATAIPNPNGTAPGWYVQRDGKTIVAMPGPPQEMQPMWQEWVQSRVEGLLPGAVSMRSVMSFGIGESTVEERIEDILTRSEGVTVATYAKSNGIQVHITVRAASSDEADTLAAETETEVAQRLGSAVFGRGDDSLADVVGDLLIRSGLILATMESVTGGDLANQLTNTAGSSSYFRGGIVAYTEEAKARYGVDRETMARHGLISAQTAAAMARAVRDELNADVGLSVTGIAGRDEVEGKPPGTVFIGLSLGERDDVREIHRPAARQTVKRFAAQCALDFLRRTLLLECQS